MRKYIYDAAICAAVIASAALLLVLPSAKARFSSEILFAQISVNGSVEKTLLLSENSRYVCSNGIVVSVENGTAGIVFSDCKDKLCMHNRKLNKNGDTAVCLPNRTVIVICGNRQTEVDGIVG